MHSPEVPRTIPSTVIGSGLGGHTMKTMGLRSMLMPLIS